MPITERAASDWADAHLNELEKLALFDDWKSPRSLTTMKLPDSVLQMLENISKKTGRSRNQIIAAAVREYVADVPEPEL